MAEVQSEIPSSWMLRQGYGIQDRTPDAANVGMSPTLQCDLFKSKTLTVFLQTRNLDAGWRRQPKPPCDVMPIVRLHEITCKVKCI